MKSRSREIGELNHSIALKFYRHSSSSAADVPVKYQSDRTTLNMIVAASRLCEILQLDVLLDIEKGSRAQVANFCGIFVAYF